MNETRFYHCDVCDTVIGMIHDGGMPISCCGDELEAMLPVPCKGNECPISVNKDEYRIHVTVERTTPKIEWLYLETDRGGQRKALSCGKDACEVTVSFALAEEMPRAVYAYSGGKLYKKEI